MSKGSRQLNHELSANRSKRNPPLRVTSTISALTIPRKSNSALVAQRIRKILDSVAALAVAGILVAGVLETTGAFLAQTLALPTLRIRSPKTPKTLKNQQQTVVYGILEATKRAIRKRLLQQALILAT